MSYYRNQLEEWLKRIDVCVDSVLDIGGGEKPVKTRVNSWEVSKYKILDSDAQFKPDIFQNLNHEMAEEKAFSAEKFDVVFCLEVMEYIFNPVAAHFNVCSYLKPGGVAYISYPTIYPLHNPPGIDYLRYSKNAIEKLLGSSGFSTWEITPRIATEGQEPLAQFYRVEGMHPMRGTMDIYHIGYLVKAYKNTEN